MTLSTSWPGPTGLTDSIEARKALAPLLVRDTSAVPRAGIFPRSTSLTPLVTARANMQVDVAAFEAAAVRGGGPLFMTNDGVVQVTIGAAPASNQRTDIIYFKQNETMAPFSDANDLAGFGVVVGTAGPGALGDDAALAAIPGATEIARITIPSTATATNSVGVVITQTAPYTALAGGVVQFRSTTEMNLWATAIAGQLALNLASGVLYKRVGAAWVPSQPSCSLRKSVNQNLGTSAAALSWDVEISDPAGMHDNVTNNSRIYLLEPGMYEITVNAYNNNTSGMGTIYGRLNGTTDIAGSLDRDTADATAALPLRTVFTQLGTASTDYIEIMVLHSTAAGNIAGGTTQGSAVVTVKRIGPQ